MPRADDNPPIVRAMYDLIFGPGRDPVAEPGTNTGTPGDWWTTFAAAPDVLQHCVDGFALYQSPTRRLDPVLRELGQTRVGWARGSLFVFSQHCKSCRAVGVPEEKIEAIAHWAVADCFDEVERAVLAYTDALVYDGGRVADGVVAVLRRHLSDEEVLELTYITCMYDMHGVMSRALRTELDDVPERVVEEGDRTVSALDVLEDRPPRRGDGAG
ncbi:MAG TPA: carboxymuconolactone decarboxylase family protein [Acidimicrobiales bacterium]|nr:carboxymuconolactone decarboxylase family protein [Acidimicrobiales bacterium]